MAIDFPASPTLDDIYTDPTSGNSWQWDGTKWVSYAVDSAIWQRAGTVVSPRNAGDQLNLDGGVSADERTITAGAFDLATGNFWTVGAIAIPNPTNAVAGASGLIRVTAAPTGWGTNFSTAPTITTVPAIIPFYVESSSSIRLGQAVVVA